MQNFDVEAIEMAEIEQSKWDLEPEREPEYYDDNIIEATNIQLQEDEVAMKVTNHETTINYKIITASMPMDTSLAAVCCQRAHRHSNELRMHLCCQEISANRVSQYDLGKFLGSKESHIIDSLHTHVSDFAASV
jgi:hypothetical protein